jgi:phospholipid transport system substrate-binding protein
MKPIASFSAQRVRHLCRRWGPVILLVTLASGAHAAVAQDVTKSAEPVRAASVSQPLELVRSAVTRAVAIVQSQPAGDPESGSRRAEFRHVAGELFDFDDMSRRILAQHWAGASVQEQDKFVLLFTGVLVRVYMSAIGNYPLTTISFQGVSVRDSDAQVWSRMSTERGRDVSVIYRLFETDGRWSVNDVVIDGISLISSYRSQFNTVLRRSTFAQLLEGMQSREAQLVSRSSQ